MQKCNKKRAKISFYVDINKPCMPSSVVFSIVVLCSFKTEQFSCGVELLVSCEVIFTFNHQSTSYPVEPSFSRKFCWIQLGICIQDVLGHRLVLPPKPYFFVILIILSHINTTASFCEYFKKHILLDSALSVYNVVWIHKMWTWIMFQQFISSHNEHPSPTHQQTEWH